MPGGAVPGGAPSGGAAGLIEALSSSAGAGEGSLIGTDPLSVLEAASRALPQRAGDGGKPALSVALNVVLLLTVLSIAPAIVIMCTSFVRIIIVLGLLKQALGTQSLPPSQVILGLSLFMTFFVMGPTFQRVHKEAILPYERGEITSQLEMWDRAKAPVRDFMFDQIEATGNWSAVFMMLNYKGVDTSRPELLTRADVDTITLIPAFMLSELKTAFMMGFRVYLPFLVIDMVISSLLISMSMMMLPPVLISLPFKLLLFVLVDGWQLVVGSLMSSFAHPDAASRLSETARSVGLMTGMGG
ncbi:MAG: flagellar type III secretion system pore protein FliP [Phycisphaerales bacterium]|nr:flagellar type III secretion system pore protein FliP [Phycisphaerales bacterium]